MNAHLRQTGRTTRMIEKAVARQRLMQPVVIFTHDKRYARDLQDLANRAVGGRATLITVEPVPDDFNWETMTVPNRYQGYTILVDHFAVEKQLQRVDEHILRLQQLARQLYSLTT